MTNHSEEQDEEVVTDVSEGGKRKIKVYDPRGDFIIEVPDGAKLTFGYFNPVSSNENRERFGGAGDNVARQTALRVYKGATTGPSGNQLACFIGVRGFRDLSIGMTRMSRKITVEQNFMDDGEEAVWGGKRRRELVAHQEDEYT
jgi:hypothetical protein